MCYADETESLCLSHYRWTLALGGHAVGTEVVP